MRITMISHASVLIEDEDVAILTDPWLMGEAFNDSWALISKPHVTPDTIKSVSHIWTSHEHPDHLHFPTLQAVPNREKTKITLLYQQHFSPRVIHALGKLGYGGLQELPLSRWVKIGKKVSVMCCSIGTIDSLLVVKSGDLTALNLNDCIMGSMAARAVSNRVGPSVDVLLAQFSFANWVGNPEDSQISENHQKLAQMRNYIKYFKPRRTIPFASFVYFCHEENRFMNAWANMPHQVYEDLRDCPTQLQFLYNGDSWSSEAGWQLNGDPLERFRSDYEKIPELPYRSHSTYPLNEVLSLGQKLIDKVHPHFKWFLLRKATPIHFYVYDIDKTIRFDLRGGTVQVLDRPRNECDIELGSQALWYAFRYPWGFGTLEVSGRYKLINRKVNKWGLYLCHVYSSALDPDQKWISLLSSRSSSFWWSKRHEILGRLLEKLPE